MLLLYPDFSWEYLLGGTPQIRYIKKDHPGVTRISLRAMNFFHDEPFRI